MNLFKNLINYNHNFVKTNITNLFNVLNYILTNEVYNPNAKIPILSNILTLFYIILSI